MWGSTQVVVLLLSFTAVLNAAALPPYRKPGSKSLFLGTVEGKVFVADSAKPMSWNEAKTFCSSIGMRLASVETNAQKNFLAGNNHPEFQAYYWTAGRDARSPQQFVWDHNSLPVSANVDIFIYYVEARSCVLFNSRTGIKSYESFYCELGASVNGEFGALCESI